MLLNSFVVEGSLVDGWISSESGIVGVRISSVSCVVDGYPIVGVARHSQSSVVGAGVSSQSCAVGIRISSQSSVVGAGISSKSGVVDAGISSSISRVVGGGVSSGVS